MLTLKKKTAEYIAAAAANLIFGNLVGSIGWNGILLLWSSIGVIGVITTLFARKTQISNDKS